MIARLFTPRLIARRLPAALVVVMAVAIATPSLAQGASPSPTPAAILIAKQILELKDSKKTVFAPLVRGVIEKARDELIQTNFMWSKDLNEVAAKLETQYAPRADELLDAAARIYASHFTEQELRQILAWDQSPIGRKMLTEEPKAFEEYMAHSGEWGENFSEEVIVKMRDEMKKRGHDL
jgi:uncharacterized protein